MLLTLYNIFNNMSNNNVYSNNNTVDNINNNTVNYYKYYKL